jgi:adhesin transport system outer membrane protein
MGWWRLCAVLGTLTWSAPADAQTMQAELGRLLGLHPLIEASEAEIEGAAENSRAVFGDFLPQVSLSGRTGVARTDSPSRRAADDTPYDAVERKATLTVTQKVFDGFKRESRYGIARQEEGVAATDREATVQEVMLEGVVAYHNVLRFTRVLEMARESEAKIQDQLALEDERVARGGGVAIDVLFAKTRLQIAKEQRVAFEGALADARARYAQVFQRMPTPERMVEPIPPIELLPEGVAAAHEVAEAENPQVVRQDLQARIADRERDVAYGDYAPEVDLVGEANYEEDFDGVPGDRTDLSVGVRLRWDLFDGFSREARVGESAARYSAEVQRLTQARRKVREDVDLAFNELETARQRVVLLDNAVNIASEVFEARKRLRQAGRESAVNVLDAETELFNAQIKAVAANFDARVATYRVLAAIGRLDPARLNLRGYEAASD